MNNYLSWKGDFKKYFSSLGADELNYGRYHTMKIAIGLFLQRKGTLIVETGCQREIKDWGGGCSTSIFGEVVETHNKQLISIDNNHEHLQLAKQVVEGNPNVSFIESDSIEALKKLDCYIDLLYLDSLDFPYGPLLDDYGGKEDLNLALDKLREVPDEVILFNYGDVILPCQQHCLNEVLAAEPCLTRLSILLIDDNALPGGGKARLAKKYLACHGWELILDGYQTLWIKNE